MKISITAAVTLAGLAGCTTWGTTNVYGPQREVGRKLLGSPALAESSSSSLAAGFSGARGGGLATAGLGANTESMKLTHCVQQAEVYYEQPFEIRPKIVGRGKDVVGAIVLGVIGLSVIGATSASQDPFWQPGDRFYEEPPHPGPGYAMGGAFLIGGIGLLAYSYAKLPSQPQPAIQRSMREWPETKLVESTGCAMPAPAGYGPMSPSVSPSVSPSMPAPAAPAPAAPTGDDAAARLRTLDSLRASGVISETEYQRKRAEIIDGL